jgi:1,2-phenylacetyl-CoA epoxidase catalytic subunit
MGLRHVPNAELKARWEAETHAVLARLGLNAPA